MTMATRILIVESPYYQEIAEELAKGAIAALNAANTEVDRVSVPGALEIPPAIAMASETDRYDGFVALGCVIRGETSHYDIVANESARALMALNLEGLAIGNGILTCDTGEQAKVRADAAGKNKGADAANAALALIKVREDMSRGE
ncbi:MAG: 6,7-dimethyl-8-ribityllumazine synthase [Hyphomicrobiales bacterium]